MNLTLKLKLQPGPEQADALRATMRAFNDACNYIAGIAFERHIASKSNLQKLCYYKVRERYGLSAQMAIRAIAKVCEVYCRDKDIKPRFRPYGSMVYDQRILSWKGLEAVSILTLRGRIIVPMVMCGYHRPRMERISGQADLIYSHGKFYLCVVVEVPEPDKIKTVATLGIDLGLVNIAVDSDGYAHPGKGIDRSRRKHAALRAALQAAGTKSAKRHLKRLSGREARFARDANHCISKSIVAKAKHTGRAIALENIKGIRTRIRVRKAQRTRHASWSFSQLRHFIEYKAALAGVPVIIVNPAYTSQECPHCHTISKRNRLSRDRFECIRCGYADPADAVAAANIAARASVNTPIVPGHLVPPSASGTSPRL